VQQVQERGLAIFDVVTFLRDHVAPHLDLRKQNSTVAVHATCSDRKMGTADALADLTAMCVAEVIRPAGVECCGFAGDKGFVTPELNAHATRKLARDLPDTCTDGYSSSRTCEIGLTFHSGRPYRSVAYLLDACSAHMDKDIRNKAESV
jgi:D-lactate dehydrogenase